MQPNVVGHRSRGPGGRDGTIQATELLYIWEKTWVVGRFVDVEVTM